MAVGIIGYNNILSGKNDNPELKNSNLITKKNRNSSISDSRDQIYGISDQFGSIKLSAQPDSSIFSLKNDFNIRSVNPTFFQQNKYNNTI